jgi:hypothetical protein
VNARAAYAVYKEAGYRFTPWSTFNQGMARPSQDYSKSIGGVVNTVKQKIGIASGAAKGQLPSAPAAGNNSGLANQLQNSGNPTSQTFVRSGTVGSGQETPTNPVLEILKGLIPAGHTDPVLDLAFIGFGSVFIIMGIFILLTRAARSDTGRAVIGGAVKLAAL